MKFTTYSGDKPNGVIHVPDDAVYTISVMPHADNRSKSVVRLRVFLGAMEIGRDLSQPFDTEAEAMSVIESGLKF